MGWDPMGAYEAKHPSAEAKDGGRVVNWGEGGEVAGVAADRSC